MTFTLTTASAGSGKTYALTEALARSISEHGRKPSQVIATTFTVRAAAELAERVQQRLIDEGLHQAAHEIPAALIGTVNSVAGRIVQLYAIDAGLSPELRVLGDDEQRRMFSTALDPVIAAAERSHRDLLHRLGYDQEADAGQGYGATGQSWVATVRRITELARANAISAEDLAGSEEFSIQEFFAMIDGTRDDSATPPVPDQRAAWAAQFRELTAQIAEDVRDAHEHYSAHSTLPKTWKSDGAKFTGATRTLGNVEKALAIFQHHAKRLEEGGPEALTWADWMACADVAKLKAPGVSGVPGVRPKAVFAPLRDAIHGITAEGEVSPGILGDQAFRADCEALIRLAFDTAREGLARYASYKKDRGVMDFTDQEALALELVTRNERVRHSLRSRYTFLAVDEFQDTSPLQLQLFLELSELMKDVVWVGDPKQSIYAFRGADPQLMDAVASAQTASADGADGADREDQGGLFAGSVRTGLTDSYRSSEPLVGFVNALFTGMFASMDPEEVALDIPASREATRHEGRIEIWHEPDKGDVPGDRVTVGDFRASIAWGIADLLKRGETFDGKPVTPGDIAVLSRNGTGLSDIVDALESVGVPATGPARSLLTTRQGQIISAALASLVDPDDTLALMELVSLLPSHEAHETWFDDLGNLESRDERREAMHGWRADPALAGLEELRTMAANLSPSELMRALIDALALPDLIKSWTRVAERLDHLDAFVGIAAEYEKNAASDSHGMSVAGLQEAVADRGAEYRRTDAGGAVLVTTIHQAKGLGRPVVVSILPDSPGKDNREAVSAVPRTDGVFDARRPLDGRSILFLPKLRDSFPPLARALATNAHVLRARKVSREEEARLQYVSLTRAKYLQILAAPKGLDKTGLNDMNPEAVDRDAAIAAAWPADPEPGEGGEAQAEDGMSVISEVASERTPAEAGGREKSDEPEAVTMRICGTRIPAGLPGATNEVRGEDGRSTVELTVPVRRFGGRRLQDIQVNEEIVDLWGDHLPGVSAPEAGSAEVSVADPWDEDLDGWDDDEEAPRSSYVEPRTPLAARDVGERVPRGVSFEAGLAARFTASASASAGIAHDLRLHPIPGRRDVTTGAAEWNLVGEALHTYLATPYRELTPEQRQELARGIHSRWLAGSPVLAAKVAPQSLVDAGEAWDAWLTATHTGATHATEVPVSWWNEDGQVMEGWIDALLELADGRLIVVDHKSFPGTDPAQILAHVREDYVGQMATYMDAIEAARGVRPTCALVHFALSGHVVEVRIPG